MEVIPPSSHLRLTASQGKLDCNLAESQNPARESGENSRRKVQNVVIDNRAVSDQAELSRLGSVSRARISQIMNLLNLAREIQEALLFLPMGFSVDKSEYPLTAPRSRA